MKLEDFIIIKDEIEEELGNIDELYNYYQKTLKKDLDQETEMRINASILADFYMALEKIFKLIAREIDQNQPQGEHWHKKLLRQMSIEMPGIRLKVIDKNLFHNLEEYLKFRHLVRNIYGFHLKKERFEKLLRDFGENKMKFEKQLRTFLQEMEDIILSAEDD